MPHGTIHCLGYELRVSKNQVLRLGKKIFNFARNEIIVRRARTSLKHCHCGLEKKSEMETFYAFLQIHTIHCLRYELRISQNQVLRLGKKSSFSLGTKCIIYRARTSQKHCHCGLEKKEVRWKPCMLSSDTTARALCARKHAMTPS